MMMGMEHTKHFNQLRFHFNLFDICSLDRSLSFVYVAFNIFDIDLADASFRQTCKRFQFKAKKFLFTTRGEAERAKT